MFTLYLEEFTATIKVTRVMLLGTRVHEIIL